MVRKFIPAFLLLGVAALVFVARPMAHAQLSDSTEPQPNRREVQLRRFAAGGAGAEIGVTVREVDPKEADRQRLNGGALIEDVRPDSPAEKAGIKKNDVVTEFDG